MEEAPEPGVGLCAADRPPRLFPRPCSLDAEVGASGQIRAARLLGKRRRATAVAGPERLCGEWWEGEAYRRDYYRVQFEGLGPVWIFRDAEDG
ncbi:MAG TPA: DNA polymerase Y family protein, partial [Myxococcales bacterium]|nr:DNA polymerase Y family protein [Myxococcales bacterium]